MHRTVLLDDSRLFVIFSFALLDFTLLTAIVIKNQNIRQNNQRLKSHFAIPAIPSHSKMKSKQSKSRDNPGKCRTLLTALYFKAVCSAGAGRPPRRRPHRPLRHPPSVPRRPLYFGAGAALLVVEHGQVRTVRFGRDRRSLFGSSGGGTRRTEVKTILVCGEPLAYKGSTFPLI